MAPQTAPPAQLRSEDVPTSFVTEMLADMTHTPQLNAARPMLRKVHEAPLTPHENATSAVRRGVQVPGQLLAELGGRHGQHPPLELPQLQLSRPRVPRVDTTLYQ